MTINDQNICKIGETTICYGICAKKVISYPIYARARCVDNGRAGDPH